MKFALWELVIIAGAICAALAGLVSLLDVTDYSRLQANDQGVDFSSIELDYPDGTPAPNQPMPAYSLISTIPKEEHAALLESTKLNINTCTPEELMGIKGIGQRTAEDIISRRPYATLRGLRDVKGIGVKTFAKISPFLTIGKPEDFSAEYREAEAAKDSGKSTSSKGSSKKKSGKALTGKINLNSATSEELQKLPRIGAKTAERILKYREENGPFNQLEDLMNVKGIGEKTFEQLKDSITL